MLVIRSRVQFEELVKPGQELWTLGRVYCEPPHGIVGPRIFLAMEEIGNPNGPRITLEDRSNSYSKPFNTEFLYGGFLDKDDDGTSPKIATGVMLTQEDAFLYLKDRQRAAREDPIVKALLMAEIDDVREFEDLESRFAEASARVRG